MNLRYGFEIFIKRDIKTNHPKFLSENKRLYRYEMTQSVKELTFGALCPILHKLEKEGVVQTEAKVVNNRKRIYYSLTETRESKTQEKIKELEEFLNTLETFLNPNFELQYGLA